MHVLRRCPVCECSQAALLHTIHYPAEENRILPTEYRIVSCSSCGMVFDDFDADASTFARYYHSAEKYALKNIAGSGGESEEDKKRFQKIADRIVPFINDKNSHIADIGSGRGELLHELNQRGYRNLSAVDSSKKCIAAMKNNTNWKTVHCALEELEGKLLCDFIICSQLFEHLFSPAAALQILSKILTPSGMLFIEVPNARCYEKYLYKPYHYFDGEHINHFSVEYLKRILHANGFKVLLFGETENKLLSDIVYPDCYALARKTTEPVPVMDAPSTDYTEKIMLYLEKSAKLSSLQQTLIQSQNPARRYFLWGLGAYGLKLLNSGLFDSWNIAGLIDIDQSKQGRIIRGHSVYTPSILKKPENRTACVCILSAIYEEQIRRQLQEMGFSGDVIRI